VSKKHHSFGFGSFLAILLALGFVMMLTPSGDKSAPTSSTGSVQRVASDGMWHIAIKACSPDGKCAEGTMNKGKVPLFVSQAECERGAQDILESYRTLGLDVKYVRCVAP
jgi:hypothetical protein